MKTDASRWTEWLLTITLLIILLALFVLAKIQSSLLEAPTISVPLIEVTLTGAVQKPGVYSLESGTPLREFLLKAKPDRYADLRSLNVNEKISSSCAIEITELEQLSISVSGAVKQEGSVSVPCGSRLVDLKKYVSFSSNADLKCLKSQRLLKDGEQIIISSIE